MTRGKGKGIGTGIGLEILTSAEKEGLLDERRELEDSLKETQSYGKGTKAEMLDKSQIEGQIKRIDQAIAEREIPKISGIDKDRLVKELEELAETLKENLPTRDEMDHPSKNPGAIRKHMRWLNRNKHNINRWRYLQRIINADDPRSIENLRREK